MHIEGMARSDPSGRERAMPSKIFNHRPLGNPSCFVEKNDESGTMIAR
jgi:hypothetical protein